MSLRTRRIIYIVFIFAFLVITPLVSLYAIGYRVNLNSFKGKGFIVQKTGMLILDSRPRGASIYFDECPGQFLPGPQALNNKKREQTPAKIKNLPPGDYKVRIELDGYWPWEKKLTVWQGESTFAEDIYLFKNNLPSQILNENAQSLTPSSHKRYFLASTTDKIIIFDTDNDNELFSFSASSSPEFINPRASFNNRNNKLIINNTVLDLAQTFFINNIIELSATSSSIIKWSENDENLLYYTSGNAIYSVDLTSRRHKPILINSQISDYLIKDDKIYTLVAVGQASNLNIYNISDQSLALSLRLPYSPDYRFINEKHNIINLYDSAYHFLYLIDSNRSINPLVESLSNVILTEWIDDNRLLYSNGFEIWIYNLENNNKSLLTRISDEIVNLYWHPSNNYVIYITKNTIYTIELDDREKRNISELLKLDMIKWPFFSNDGNTIYFYTEIGNLSGVYKLSL